MLFNSLDFAFFLPFVFAVYWLLAGRLRIQNGFVAAASYVFYGWWDWRYLSLIFLSTLIDYWVGLRLAGERPVRERKQLLSVSLMANLGLLCFFKYSNFFLDNFRSGFTFLGYRFDEYSLAIVLPVGISFYTFQTLSYSIDVYRRKMEPTKDFVAFAAFVSFFPQLVAGPIERATALLPQFYTEREFSYSLAVTGLRQMLWGFFKKVVVADNCAEHANLIFAGDEYSGSTLVVGAVLFAFQIYGDFSGYSDIAIGTARLFGFNLMQNFAFPYFSRDIAEFWRRWHISLSTWFRDYLYVPLGGSRGGKWQSLRNVFAIFVVSGFWHGANWTFVVWGALNALYFVPLQLLGRNRRNLDVVASGRWFPSLRECAEMITTFALTLLAWVFFRADSISHALDYLSRTFSATLLSFPEVLPKSVCLFVALMLAVEWTGRDRPFALEKFGLTKPRFVRWGFYLTLVFLIFVAGGTEQEFIYFQF